MQSQTVSGAVFQRTSVSLEGDRSLTVAALIRSSAGIAGAIGVAQALHLIVSGFDVGVLPFDEVTGRGIADVFESAFVFVLDRVFAAFGFIQDTDGIFASEGLLGSDAACRRGSQSWSVLCLQS